jgi:hypothetical protein
METAQALMGLIFNASLVQIIVGTIVASYFAKGQPEPEESAANHQSSETQPA